MPFGGKLIMAEYVPGDLFSVNDKTVSSVDKIFSRNERVVCYFETNFGEVVLILVGAIFVGSMHINSIGQISPPYKKEVKQYSFDEPIIFKKGEEFGRFNMGSTVILLSPGSEFANLPMDAKDAIQMGQALSP
jgi:phosphatidylserine decarboxylase